MAATTSILATKNCSSQALVVVSVEVETTALDEKHGCRVSSVFLRVMDAAKCKSQFPATIRFSNRRLWRLSEFYPVAWFNGNKRNKKFLNTVGGHMADIVYLRTKQGNYCFTVYKKIYTNIFLEIEPKRSTALFEKPPLLILTSLTRPRSRQKDNIKIM